MANVLEDEELEIYHEVSLNYFMNRELEDCPICGSLNVERNRSGEIACNDCEFNEDY
jgi:ribosomal protein L37AE/L43A